MKKVLHIIYALQGGGAETQLRLLVDGNQNSRFFVFCVENCGIKLNCEKVINFERKSKLAILSIFKNLDQSIEELNPDIVHIWLPATLAVPALIVCGFRKRKCIFSYRNRMFFSGARSLVQFVLACLFSDRIVSNNPIEQSSILFRWLYNSKNGCLIPNAVEIDEIKFNHKVRKTRKLISIGRLTFQKNFDTLIIALNGIKDRNDWELDIFGQGEDESGLKHLIFKHGLENRIHMKGFCDDIHAQMCASDLLIFPSRFEGMPNVLLEALGVGIPVIASDIPANRAVIGDEDCLEWFSLEDYKLLGEKIKKFLDNPTTWHNRIECGRKIAGRYSVEEMRNRYFNLYNGMVS